MTTYKLCLSWRGPADYFEIDWSEDSRTWLGTRLLAGWACEKLNNPVLDATPCWCLCFSHPCRVLASTFKIWAHFLSVIFNSRRRIRMCSPRVADAPIPGGPSRSNAVGIFWAGNLERAVH